MSSSEEFWNEYYEKNIFKNGKEASLFLKQMISRLQKGKTLDIAMGEGQNAVFLSEEGFQVKGFDLSSMAIERASQLASEKNIKLETSKADLDLYLFGLLEYDSILMCFYKPTISRYYSEMIRALKQGGTLLIESWLDEEQKQILLGDQQYLDCYFKSNEILNHLKGMKILYYNEGLVSGHYKVECLAQKLLDKDMLKYGALFEAHSASKETKMSSQQELAESLFRKK